MNNSYDIGPGDYDPPEPRKRYASLMTPKAMMPHKSVMKSLLRENRQLTYLDDLEDSSEEDNGPGPGNYDPYINTSFKQIRVK